MVSKDYLEFELSLSDLHSMNDKDKTIITIGFAKITTISIDGQENRNSHRGNKFSFEVALEDPEDIDAFANVLFCGINNSLKRAFVENKEDFNIPY